MYPWILRVARNLQREKKKGNCKGSGAQDIIMVSCALTCRLSLIARMGFCRES